MNHALIVALLVLTGCSFVTTSTLGTAVRAVYLVRGQGQLPLQDIRSYPEAVATDSFEQLRSIARSKVAIWIDVNAVDLVDRAWLSEKPQSRYPFVLVRNGSERCSFRETLVYFTFEDIPGYPCDPPPPGFSVSIQRRSPADGGTATKKLQPLRESSASRTACWKGCVQMARLFPRAASLTNSDRSTSG